MIHGLYIKTRPKSKWHLVSTSVSAEIAEKDKTALLEQAKLSGKTDMQVAIKVFDSSFYIPEYLSFIEEQKPMYN